LNWRLSRRAARDVENILRYTGVKFGPRQARNYSDLIRDAAARVARDPFGLGTRSRDELRPGCRTFHVARVAGRSSAARHVVFYRLAVDEIVVLRVLHDSMNPRRYRFDD
jgi:toxin ParE1/3/4